MFKITRFNKINDVTFIYSCASNSTCTRSDVATNTSLIEIKCCFTNNCNVPNKNSTNSLIMSYDSSFQTILLLVIFLLIK